MSYATTRGSLILLYSGNTEFPVNRSAALQRVLRPIQGQPRCSERTEGISLTVFETFLPLSPVGLLLQQLPDEQGRIREALQEIIGRFVGENHWSHKARH